MKKMMKSVLATFALLGSVVMYGQETKEINLDRSHVEWEGKKIIGSSHEGILRFKSGTLTFDAKNNLTAGEFVVDMTSLIVTDLYGEGKEKLEAHLKNEDFFDVEKFPESSLKFTKIKKIKDSSMYDKEYRITADLTIKGMTKPVTFELEIEGNKAETDNLKVDRTKYGIRYGSGSFFNNLGDKAIRNNFELDVDLYF